jgi:DNA-binding CsgD family transcriptional regulator
LSGGGEAGGAGGGERLALIGGAEIAKRLYMSLATVKAYVSRLLVKLDTANRVQFALLVQDAAAGRPR